MGTPLGRVGDTAHGICVGGCPKCPHGREEEIQRLGSSFNVFCNGKRIALKGTWTKVTVSAHGGKRGMIMAGSSTVKINGKPAANVGSRTSCWRCWQRGEVNSGSDNVFCGG